MDELARVHGVEVSPLSRSRYWRRLVNRLEQLPATPHSALLRDAVTAIEQTSGATELEFGSWHGDWAPWNMTVIDGRVCVWDWEKFETGVPVGFDAVHFDVHGPVVAGKRTAEQAFGCTIERIDEVFSAHGTSPDAAAATLWLYAVDLAVAYLTDREMEVGNTRMSRLSSWLEPVLRSAATHAQGARQP